MKGQKPIDLAQQPAHGLVLESVSFSQNKVRLPRFGRIVINRDDKTILVNFGTEHKPDWRVFGVMSDQVASAAEAVVNIQGEEQVPWVLDINGLRKEVLGGEVVSIRTERIKVGQTNSGDFFIQNVYLLYNNEYFRALDSSGVLVDLFRLTDVGLEIAVPLVLLGIDLEEVAASHVLIVDEDNVVKKASIGTLKNSLEVDYLQTFLLMGG